MVLTIAEAAAALGIAAGTVRRQIGLGRMAVDRRSQHIVLIESTEVERYRAENLGRRGRPFGASSMRRAEQVSNLVTRM